MQTADSVLAKISKQKVSEDIGATLLGSTHEHLRQLRRERAALEVHEAWLGKEITTIQAFEQDHPWCRLHPPEQQTGAGMDLRQLFVDSVVIYLGPNRDTSSQANRE